LVTGKAKKIYPRSAKLSFNNFFALKKKKKSNALFKKLLKIKAFDPRLFTRVNTDFFQQ
jgi:hypothetical protein